MSVKQWERLARSVRIGARHWTRQPIIAATVVVMTAAAVGLNATTFSVLKTVAFRVLPYPHADRLVAIGGARKDCPWCTLPVSESRFESWRRNITGVELWGAYRGTSLLLEYQGVRRNVDAVLVTPGVLQLFDIRLSRGSPLTAEDAEVGGLRRALISVRIWRDMFHADSMAIGRSLSVNGHPVQVAGIVDSSSALPGAGDYQVWVTPAAIGTSANEKLSAFALLHAGVSPAVVGQRILATDRAFSGIQDERIVAVPLRRQLAISASLGLVVIQVLAVIGLIIAAANVAGLIVAKTEVERHLVALRLVLGATRGDLLVAAIGDIAILVTTGVALGVTAAWWCVPLSQRLLALPLPPGYAAHLDSTVALIAIAAGGVVALGASLAVTRDMLSSDLRRWLQEGSPSSIGSMRTRRTMSRLVTVELGLAVTLAVTAAVLAGSYLRVARADSSRPGITVGVSSISIPAGVRGGTIAAQLNSALHGVKSVVGSEIRVPYYLDLSAAAGRVLYVDGSSSSTRTTQQLRGMGIISLGGMDGRRLVHGRFFSRAEMEHDADDIIIVNEAFASQVWPGHEAVGRRVKLAALGPNEVWRTVVGVVADGGDEGDISFQMKPGFLLPGIASASNASVVVFARGDFSVLKDTLDRAISRAIPGANAYFGNMTARQAEMARGPRTRMVFMVCLAGIAMLMAMAGLISLIRYATAVRRREFAIRSALGSTRGRLLARIVVDSLRLARNGLLLGGLGCVVANYVLVPSLFFGAQAGGMRASVLVLLATVATTAATGLLAGVAATHPPIDLAPWRG